MVQVLYLKYCTGYTGMVTILLFEIWVFSLSYPYNLYLSNLCGKSPFLLPICLLDTKRWAARLIWSNSCSLPVEGIDTRGSCLLAQVWQERPSCHWPVMDLPCFPHIFVLPNQLPKLELWTNVCSILLFLYNSSIKMFYFQLGQL